MRGHDWSGSPLGVPHQWPQTLRNVVSLLLRSSFPMFVAWGPRLGFLYNDAYAEILGAKHPAALGRPFEDIWSEIWDDVGPLAQRALRGEATYVENFPLVMSRRGYDEQTWFTFSYSPVADEDGTISGMYCVCTETTRSVVAEAAREAQTQRLASLAEQRQLALDAARLGWWQYDPATGVVTHDERYGQIYGLDGSGPRHVDEISRLLHPDDAPRLWAAVQAATQPTEPEPYAVQYRIMRRDGTVRWLEARGIPTFEGRGASRFVASFAGTVADVTESRLAEEVLRANEARFRLMADASPASLWLTDPLGACTFLSHQWYEFTGQTEQEALGLGWTTAMHPDDQEHARRLFLEANRTRTYLSMEYRLRTADGSYRWVMDLGRPWYSETGEYAGMVGVVFDIDARKRAEEAVEEASRRKDQFLATLAHELRNPLAPISNALQVWPRLERDPEEARRLREMMERQVRQMIRLIDDLLDVSRITRGKIELRRERLDLSTPIRSAVEAMQPFIESYRHALHVELPAQPLYVDADLGRLVQVFGNLLHNAAKFTGRGGRIVLKAKQEGDAAVVSIRDNGSGIPRDMLREVFEMFAQADQTLGRAHGGLGIGLTLVETLVALHDGTVEARSEGPGQGSEFIVRLPVAAGPAVEAVPADDRVLPLLPTRRVLVVDDVQSSADTLVLMLQFMGQDARAVYDGAAALEAWREFAPEVAFVDIAMPGMDGYGLARRIRERWGPSPLLVALTGFGQEDDRRRAMEAGFDFHLVKPTTIQAVHQVFGAPRAARKA
ncbi:PAS domain S-box protein [Lysobacter sp. UC]|uniref:histidine kinase n=2 Tax=Lysobacter arvi TaxID=3038776 RepID=A0ABU1CA12_9GAMM|nr:PAS domain S-box protein [Lysobacter arvi]